MGWVGALRELVLGPRVAPAHGPGAPHPVEPPPRLVDPLTQTFWSRGAMAPATLVEAEAVTAPAPERPASRRVSELINAQDRPPTAGRPRADPAFSEAVFVELMRARQYLRAYQLLAAECQQSWGSAEGFAAQHSDHAMSRVHGVDVKQVRYLEEWTDPDRLTTHRKVAELEVEYALDGAGGTLLVPRTVHLVAAGGRWRSISYAPSGGRPG